MFNLFAKSENGEARSVRNGRARGSVQVPRDLAQVFEDLRNDYDMSRESRIVRRRTGLAPMGGSADYHIRNESRYYRDIEAARDMDRNDGIVGQVIDRAASNIVQDGFRIEWSTGDKKLDRDLRQRMEAETEDPELCDISGEMTFHDFEYLAVRSQFVDGDCGVAAVWDENCLQFFEAHNIRNDFAGDENIFLGVEMDENRRRLRYYVVPDGIDPDDTYKEPATPIDARDKRGVRQFFHVYDPKRVSMTRGVTRLAPVFFLASMLEDVNFAKLVQQQVVSCFAILRMRSMGGTMPSVQGGYGEQETETTGTGGERVIDRIAPGMEVVGGPGETIEGFSPNVPNAEYFSHARLLMQVIGVNLGLPLMMVLMDASETNFSGWRGAFEEAKRGFRHHQRNLKKRLHNPFTRWKLHRWSSDDPQLRGAMSRSGVNPFSFSWTAPGWPYIEPVKDATGDMMRIKANLTSPRRLMNERSMSWQQIVEETVEDNTLAIRAAMKAADRLNRSNKGPAIHWREVVSLPTPEGVQVSTAIPLDKTEEQIESGDQNAL